MQPAALLARIAQGDREAFSRFYDAFAGLALGLIRRILRDPAASEEVLQEVFWQIWQEAARYDPRRGSPEAWVVMRAKTRAIDKLRAIRRREKTFVAPVDDSVARSREAPGENPGVAAETRGLVRSALDSLPETQRRVIELAFFEGLTQSEIASRLGEPLGTVKTRARLGLERLRSLMTGEGKPEAMNRDEIALLAAGYALGALDAEDRARFEALLAAGDTDAIAALGDVEGAVTGLAAESSTAPPPAVKAALMARIDAQDRSREAVVQTLSAVKPDRPRRSTWTLVLSGALAAGIAAIAVGLVVSAAYDRRLTQLTQEAAALKQETERQQSLVALLRDPATQVVTLAGLEPAPGAKARMLWHATAGGLLVAQGLPPAPEGKAYELWAIAGAAAPVPAGVFTVDAKGVGSLRVAPIQAGGAVDTFAITLEPASGAPAPTGAMYLAGKL